MYRDEGPMFRVPASIWAHLMVMFMGPSRQWNKYLRYPEGREHQWVLIRSQSCVCVCWYVACSFPQPVLSLRSCLSFQVCAVCLVSVQPTFLPSKYGSVKHWVSWHWPNLLCLLYWPNIRMTLHTDTRLRVSYLWPHSHQYVIHIIMVGHIHLVFLLISTESSSRAVLLSLCLVLKMCSMGTVKAQQRSIFYCFIRFVSWFALYRKDMKKGWGGRCYNQKLIPLGNIL